jgi:hypothetical protein
MTQAIRVMIGFVLAATLTLLAGAVFAGECNGPGDDECCQVGGESVPVEVVCQNVVDANPEAYCDARCRSNAEAQAAAICGDATSTTDIGQLAFLVSVTKNSCRQAQLQAQFSSQECGDASLACDDTTQTCGDLTATSTQTCPPVNVTIDEADVDCAKCLERRTFFKDGTLRSVRERCFRCNVTGTLQIGG